jgi:hypothetical protein
LASLTSLFVTAGESLFMTALGGADSAYVLNERLLLRTIFGALSVRFGRIADVTPIKRALGAEP